jgi:hypothetical protein
VKCSLPESLPQSLPIRIEQAKISVTNTLHQMEETRFAVCQCSIPQLNCSCPFHRAPTQIQPTRMLNRMLVRPANPNTSISCQTNTVATQNVDGSPRPRSPEHKFGWVYEAILFMNQPVLCFPPAALQQTLISTSP